MPCAALNREADELQLSLLPAERPIGRVGFAPTENRRLHGILSFRRSPVDHILEPARGKPRHNAVLQTRSSPLAS